MDEHREGEDKAGGDEGRTVRRTTMTAIEAAMRLERAANEILCEAQASDNSPGVSRGMCLVRASTANALEDARFAFVEACNGTNGRGSDDGHESWAKVEAMRFLWDKAMSPECTIGHKPEFLDAIVKIARDM